MATEEKEAIIKYLEDFTDTIRNAVIVERFKVTEDDDFLELGYSNGRTSVCINS